MNNIKKANKSLKLAFSLIEMSIVILVIGILIAGISGGADLYSDYRLTSAKSLTQNSRVSRIDSLEMWVEPTQDGAFSNLVSTTPISYNFIKKPDNKQPIAKWNNVKIAQNINSDVDPYQTISDRQPIYTESAINGLPALYFDGKTDGTGDFLSFKAKFINDYSNFTIFIVEKRTNLAVKSQWGFGPYQYILSTTDFTDGLAVGPVLNGYVRIIPGSFYQIGNYLDKTYLHTFLIDENLGKKIYLNGVQKLSVADVIRPRVPNDNLMKIAYFDRSWAQDYYTGFISEIIIFSKALSDSERSDVEKYLLKKWAINLN
jgi:hypothetical protein